MTLAKWKTKTLAGTAKVPEINTAERNLIKLEISELRQQLETATFEDREPIIRKIAMLEYESRGIRRTAVSRAMTARGSNGYQTKDK